MPDDVPSLMSEGLSPNSADFKRIVPLYQRFNKLFHDMVREGEPVPRILTALHNFHSHTAAKVIKETFRPEYIVGLNLQMREAFKDWDTREATRKELEDMGKELEL
jgi:hypothetical protein